MDGVLTLTTPSLQMEEDRDPEVTAYLDSFSPKGNERKKCCGASRSLFCSECFNLVVPRSDLPSCIRDGSLKLPFNLHILLDDQRTSATGLHAATLLGKEQVTLVDIKRGDSVQDYRDCSQTYVLFPSTDSVPLSSVRDISTLVVLDCKWTQPARAQSFVSELQRVHLSSPPKQSHFWRSHTAAQGCLSTIEAIYYAALEVDPHNSDLIHLLWLFGRQRAAIQSRGIWKDRKGLPFTEAGKEEIRALRRQKMITKGLTT